MKKVFASGMILVAITFGLAASASAQRILGGYQKADPESEQVVAAAEFAVEKKSEEIEGLTLVSIEKAETQSAAGTNFRLCLKVSLDEEEQQVKVVVHRNLKQEFTLRSWTVEDCSESAASLFSLLYR